MTENSATGKEGNDGDRQNKVEQFLQQIAEVKDEPDVVALGVEAVAQAVSDAAKALTDFRVGMAKWRLPVDVKEEKANFDKMCEAHDAAMVDLESYADAIAGFMMKKNKGENKKEKDEKDVLKAMKDTLYQQLTRTGTPRLVAKLE